MNGKKYDAGKPRMDLLIPEFILGVGQALDFGAKKYGADTGWKNVENGKMRYFSAAMRHMFHFLAGERKDKESGLHPLFHAACDLMFVFWFDTKNLEKPLIIDPPIIDKAPKIPNAAYAKRYGIGLFDKDGIPHKIAEFDTEIEREKWNETVRMMREELYETELDKHTIIVPGPRALGINPHIQSDGWEWRQCTNIPRKHEYCNNNMYGFEEAQ